MAESTEPSWGELSLHATDTSTERVTRKRYQHDALKDSAISDNVSQHDVAANNAAGRLREDPVGNLVSSLASNDYHYPNLDLDHPHLYLPSKTPGHAHLYLNSPGLSPELYQELLEVLVKCGIIGKGNLNQFKASGQTMTRLPTDYYKTPTTYDRLLGELDYQSDVSHDDLP